MPVRETLIGYYRTSSVLCHRILAKLRPHSSRSQQRLAEAYVIQGNWRAAASRLEKAQKLDPNNPWIYKTLADAQLSQGDAAGALDWIKQAMAIDPNVGWFYHSQAKAYVALEDWAGAIAASIKAIDLAPQEVWFQYGLGEAYFKAGDWMGSMPALRRAIELDGLFPWSYYLLGEGLVHLDRVEEAIEVYQQIVPKRPDIMYLRHCLRYAQMLRQQELRIADYVAKARVRDRLGNRSRPRVLMLAPYPTYPPKTGAITRMFYEMKNFGERCDLAVFCFLFTKEDYGLEEQLAKYCDFPITVFSGDVMPGNRDRPQLVQRYSSHRMTKLLKLIEPANFDIVLSDFIYMAQYRELFGRAFHVLAEHNIESELLRSCAKNDQDSTKLKQLAQQRDTIKDFIESGSESDLLANYERQNWPHYPVRLVVSELDRAYLDSHTPSGKTLVVNNGVDTETIGLFPDQPLRRILFIGTMSYYPNIDGASYFAETILPLIWQQNPDIEFWIAGAQPPAAILDLAKHPKIKVIADPEDMTEVAKQCCITVVPLRIGSGTRIKILQSLAMGLPIVSTALGCEGLEIIDGQHLLVRDDPQAFADATVQLINQPTLRQNLRRQGRQLVEDQYDWNRIFQGAIDRLFAHLPKINRRVG
jgi:glycosyltransferase involved in cell wall biosynthesis/Tfp pilus assembly protein PilF